MSVLVTGGAGYIGSHMTYALVDRGEKVVVLDNLSTGNRSLVSEKATLVEGDAGDQALVRRLIDEHGVDAVDPFRGLDRGAGIRSPIRCDYYANNTGKSRALIEACVTGGREAFHLLLDRDRLRRGRAAAACRGRAPRTPISPYARSKLMTEWMLEDASRAHDFRHIVLRYFNVAGADPKGRTGQSSPRATHLIKRAAQVALGRVPHLDIFGTDYPTPDGTGVRDYIHVSDLVDAHLLALDALRGGSPSSTFNCGYGHGASVREVIATVEMAIGRPLAVHEGPRRAGDPPELIADPGRIKAVLGWRPQRDDLGEIVRSALDWERRFNS